MDKGVLLPAQIMRKGAGRFFFCGFSEDGMRVQDKPVKTTCPYCGVGCGVEALVDGDSIIGVRGDRQHPANQGRLCVKGSALHETTDLNGRLLYPEVNGTRVTWDAALDKVAQEFSRIVREHGPDAVAFYVSGQLLTEDYYVANKLMKGYIGSANIDTNSRLCMASAVAGYKRAFGNDAVPCSYEDLECADLIVLVGSNAAWAHPVVYQRIEAARKTRPGMRLIVVDPRRTATCEGADMHLPLKPGTDAVLFNGLLGWLNRCGAIDRDFISQHTNGFGAAMQAAREWTPARVAQACELPLDDVLAFFCAFSETRRSVALYSQGVNQSSSGVDKSNAIINCFLATGRIGRAGMGPFSITGQPNAMGGREVGGLANQLAAHMDFTAQDIARVQRFWNSPVIADKPGLKAVDLFKAVAEGKIRAVWIMATNPVVSMPDADAVRKALQDCELVVVSDMTRDTDTARLADILLPATGWGEKSGTVTNSERCISRQRSILPPPGEARHDWWIISQVAQRMGFAAGFSYSGPADIFREHARLSGFENDGQRAFNIGALADISDTAYDAMIPVQWPVTTQAPTGTARLFADRRFHTQDNRARFIPITPRMPANPPSVDYPYVFNTGRVRDQWHTMTRTGKATRLLSHTAEPYCEINPADAEIQSLQENDLLRISSPIGWMLARARLREEQRPGSVFVPMHWNGQFAAQARMGSLIPGVNDQLSGQPELKHGAVRVERWLPRWQAVLYSRGQVDLAGVNYWVRIPGEQYQRYELAGQDLPADWQQWLQARCGVQGVIQVAGQNNGDHCHLVILANSQPLAALYVAPDYPEIDREAVSLAFASEVGGTMDRLALLAGQAPVGGVQSGRPICACFRVGEQAIHTAIEEGCTTVDELGHKLRCGTNCGSCVPELKSMILSHHKAA